MNKYNKTQKRFLNYLVRYKRNSALLPFSEIFYSYIEKNYKEIEIELIKNEIIFYKKEVKKISYWTQYGILNLIRNFIIM